MQKKWPYRRQIRSGARSVGTDVNVRVTIVAGAVHTCVNEWTGKFGVGVVGRNITGHHDATLAYVVDSYVNGQLSVEYAT